MIITLYCQIEKCVSDSQSCKENSTDHRGMNDTGEKDGNGVQCEQLALDGNRGEASVKSIW